MTRKPTSPDPRWLPLLPADELAGDRDYTVHTTLRRYKGTAAWHFANLPPELSAQIRSRFGSTARGWGSIRVSVRIGQTQWRTSLFPDRKSGTYLFAVKAEVRKAENLSDGDAITAKLQIE